MELGLLVIIIFTVFYEPIIGYFGFQRFKSAVREKENARSNYYTYIMVGLWIPTLFILLLAMFTELEFRQIGIALPTFDAEPLGPFITYTLIAVASLYTLTLLYYYIAYQLSDSFQEKLTKTKKDQLSNLSYSVILPVSNKEKERWKSISVTVGITEEIIYRGTLIFAFTSLFPDQPIWLSILLSSLLFGLAHTYQGMSGVIKTTIIGILFSIVYIGLNSIIPLITLHFLINYTAELGGSKPVHLETDSRKLL